MAQSKTPVENSGGNFVELKREFARMDERLDANSQSMLDAIQVLAKRISNLEVQARNNSGAAAVREGTQAGHIDDLPKVPGL